LCSSGIQVLLYLNQFFEDKIENDLGKYIHLIHQMATHIDSYNSILSQIEEYSQNMMSELLDKNVFVYSMQIYKNKLMSLISQTDNETETIVSIQKPYKELFKSLFNISILSLDYLSKKNQKSKKEIIEANRDLFIRKNQDYGNSFEDFKLIGIIVRLNDKINRICTLLEKRSTGPQVNDEAIEDTINDLYNYGILALMYK
jgi:hypothetical protein